jgi:hypothetical protein
MFALVHTDRQLFLLGHTDQPTPLLDDFRQYNLLSSAEFLLINSEGIDVISGVDLSAFIRVERPQNIDINSFHLALTQKRISTFFTRSVDVFDRQQLFVFPATNTLCFNGSYVNTRPAPPRGHVMVIGQSIYDLSQYRNDILILDGLFVAFYIMHRYDPETVYLSPLTHEYYDPKGAADLGRLGGRKGGWSVHVPKVTDGVYRYETDDYQVFLRGVTTGCQLLRKHGVFCPEIRLEIFEGTRHRGHVIC